MRILIIEDEARIAKRIERLIRDILGDQITHIKLCTSLFEGQYFIDNQVIDILLLDLNLNGEDGFDVLKNVVARSFHTIIISAYAERAITAFEFGVLDFVAKPFNKARLEQALTKVLEAKSMASNYIKYLAIRKRGRIHLIEIKEIRYIQGAGIYTEIHLKNGRKEIHDKSLESLSKILPNTFARIHKSYLVAMHEAKEIIVQIGSKYALMLKNDEILPIGRSRYKQLKDKWF